MKIGDLVTRKSYNHDVKFCIIGVSVNQKWEIVAILKALYDHTFMADAPIEDLENILTHGKL